MQLKRYSVLLVVGFTGIWLLLSQSLAVPVILAGLLFSTIITAAYAGTQYAKLGLPALNATVLKAAVAYLFVFLRELIKSNFDVALRVIDPALPIHPGIVEVKTTLKSPLGRLALANSITLTPGTLTVETKDDSFFIHWIDVSSPNIEEATQKIVTTFEQYLKVIYG